MTIRDKAVIASDQADFFARTKGCVEPTPWCGAAPPRTLLVRSRVLTVLISSAWTGKSRFWLNIITAIISGIQEVRDRPRQFFSSFFDQISQTHFSNNSWAGSFEG